MNRGKLGQSLLFAVTAGILLGIVLYPDFVRSATRKIERRRIACFANLLQIDGAKQVWATEFRIPPNSSATPTWDDLKPYLCNGPGHPGEIPKCPSKGIYTIGSLKDLPTCSEKDHVMDWPH
jgi:hypothetical protein